MSLLPKPAAKVNYLNNRDILKEIHHSKNTYCWYRDRDLDHQFDLILPSVDKINQRTIVDARKNRADRIKRETGVVIDQKKIPNTDLVFRITCWDHIPKAPKKITKAEAKKKKLEEILDLDDAVEDDPLADLIDVPVLNMNYVRLNFPPFEHYRLDENKTPFMVGRSHWKGDLETGEFSREHGNMTRKLAMMFMKLCERYATRSNWRGYTYNEEMRGQALLQLSQIGLQFDESKSQNPFAYYTAAITNSFTRILNIEKKNQNIRDDILEMNGLNPSWTRQNSGKAGMAAMSGPVVSSLDEQYNQQMSNLFKKAAIFTDIHFGLKSNSTLHNEDCLAFVKWATAKAKEEGCETCLFLGDWHNNRSSLNIVTLNYSLQALEHMNDNFDRVFFIPGNHDLYYRDKRDIQSVEWAKHLPNIEICNDWFSDGNVVIAPWLCGDDHKRIPRLKGQYMFGHFELPGYMMNAMVEMPDHGEIRREDFNNFDHVFTGHFHKRQTKKNITYIGNCFPHNYADAGDDERGLTILEWGQDPVYHAWPNQPRYRVLGLSSIIDNAASLLTPDMHVRVQLDIEISYEEANFIKETFIRDHQLREMALIPNKNAGVDTDMAPGEVKFESVDQIVTDQLTNIESEFYDPKLLLKIYQNL